MKDTTLIRSIVPFSALTESEAETLLDGSKKTTFLCGERIPDEKNTVKVILSGKVTVTKTVGDKKLLMRVMEKGSVSGISSVFTDEEDEVSALTAAKKTEILFVSGDALSPLIRSNGDFAESYIRFLTSRIRFLNGRIKAYTSPDAERKLAFYLLGLAESGSSEINLGCSFSSLADILNMGRASLYRASETLTQKGLIERNGKTVKITDKEKLEKI